MEQEIAVQGCSSRLRIHLGALRANYCTVSERIAPARCAAVVKANAYGLGVAPVGAALYREGCRHFFIAQLREALPLRQATGSDAEIFILNGIDPGSETACADGGYVPVLNSVAQIDTWRTCARRRGRPLPAAVQIDSGMSRLGLLPATAAELARDADLPQEFDLRLLLTHLACADEPAHQANLNQLDRFRTLHPHFSAVPTSIANSGGVFLADDFHGQIARVGIALFGVNPSPNATGLRSVIELDARVLQIRDISQGTGVGYGLTYTAPAARRLATIAIGYADGWPRSLGGVGAAWHDGRRLPIVGRVSMDSLTVDISSLPINALAEGDFVELLGLSQTLADVARDAGTIAYEILTRLGQRHARVLIEDKGPIKKQMPGKYR